MDPDWEAELSDNVSALGMNDDDYSFDTITDGGYSRVSARPQRRSQNKKKLATIHGNTKAGMPYIMDIWTDCKNQGRISIQVHLLSGELFYKSVFVRISQNKRFLVLTFPMSPYMARSDFAFETFVIDEMQLSEQDKVAMKVVLKHHSKTAARMESVSKIVSRSNTSGFFYEQRIPLPKAVKHEFAGADGDQFFKGKRFIQYPDGSVQLHVELLVETNDGYRPLEAQSIAVARIASPPSQHASMPQPMDTSTTIPTVVGGRSTVLEDVQYTSDNQEPSKKRACTNGGQDTTFSTPPRNHFTNMGPHPQREDYEEQSISSASYQAHLRNQQQQQPENQLVVASSLQQAAGNTQNGTG